MNANVLCPGPSLASAIIHDAPLTIAVNRAILIGAADWWVFTDWQQFIDCADVDCHAAVFTTRASADSILARPEHETRFCRHARRLYEQIERIPHTTGWRIWSATAALALAYDEGAAHIDVYGADRRGELDFDGHASERNRRTAQRWAEETSAWKTVVNWITGNGVTLTEH